MSETKTVEIPETANLILSNLNHADLSEQNLSYLDCSGLNVRSILIANGAIDNTPKEN